MIAGVFLKNFKAYSNLTFIPFIEHPSEKVTVFVGENGVGKSTLIEAVNCFLQKIPPSKWDITVDKNGKSSTNQNGAFVGVVFLIKKTDCQNADALGINAISNSFWMSDFHTSWHYEAVKNFEKWRLKLIDQNIDDEYHLIVIGKNYDDEVRLTSFAHDRLMSQNKAKRFSKEKLISIYNYLLNNYGYIYIPVENRVSDVLRLQALELQQLMNKKIVDEITDIFEIKSINDSSIVNIINNGLNEYVSEINIDLTDGYKFDSQGDDENEIKTVDIINLVFKEFFSRKTLKKDGKNIKSLSSGQQRLALIDVIATILGKSHDRVGRIFLALDEPESSLDNSNRLSQFIKLFSLADQDNNQILITTHWYGLLLKPVHGRLIFIENNEFEQDLDQVPDDSIIAKNSNFNFRSYSLLNLYDQRRNFPDSIEMKSYFDLMASLWSIIRVNKRNWIICEGYEDYQYLKYYLADKIEELTILPLNGCGNVKKFYELIRIPIFEKSESSGVKGKVFCLIDNDPNYLRVEGYKSHKNLLFKKFLLSSDAKNLSLASVADQNARRTTIEDVLDVKVFIQSFKDLCEFDSDLKKIKSRLKFNADAAFVDVSESLSFLNSETTTKHDEKIVKNALSQEINKKILANFYLKNAASNDLLSWQKEIVSFFD